jgi:hypothetical protein
MDPIAGLTAPLLGCPEQAVEQPGDPALAARPRRDRRPAKLTDRTILSIAKTLIIMQALTIPPRRAVIGARKVEPKFFFGKSF